MNTRVHTEGSSTTCPDCVAGVVDHYDGEGNCLGVLSCDRCGGTGQIDIRSDETNNGEKS